MVTSSFNSKEILFVKLLNLEHGPSVKTPKDNIPQMVWDKIKSITESTEKVVVGHHPTIGWYILLSKFEICYVYWSEKPLTLIA